jgi:quinol-cytochrome oxidoreductase complex cytochrome b subunit
MNTFRHLTPRLTTKDILERAEAKARRDRWIAFGIFVGAVAAIVVLSVWRGL